MSTDAVQTLALFGSFALVIGGLVWWLSSQFSKNRHDMANALTGQVSPLRDEVDDLKERIIRLEVLIKQNGRH